jgi:hypothetical protein
LIINSGIMSSVLELAAACALFVTLPVTLAFAERSFSKLKIIKSYMRCSISQYILDGLSLLAIEIDASKRLDIDNLRDKFLQANGLKD